MSGDCFPACIDIVLKHEGAWSDHSRDPGGATMKGVTLMVFRRFYGAERTNDDLRNITRDQLAHIYRTGYWDPCRCADMPAGVDLVVFDAAVNSGPRRAAKLLQAAVGAVQDGKIGPNTLRRLSMCEPSEVIGDVCAARLRFLHGLSTWDAFGPGWERRVAAVERDALRMAQGGDA